MENLLPNAAGDLGQPVSMRIVVMLRQSWANRKLIASIVVGGAMLSVLYALYLPNSYSSTTSLMPPESSSSSSSLLTMLTAAGPAATMGSSALGITTASSVLTGVLQSRSVQEAVVKDLRLQEHYKTRLLEVARSRLDRDTSIHVDVKTGIVVITVQADSPTLAASIASDYVSELDHVVTTNRSSAAGRERAFLEERLKEIDQDLEKSTGELSQFASKSKTLDISNQGKAVVESELKLQDQLIAARMQLAGLRQNYSDDNMKVRSSRAQVEEIQHQVDKTLGASVEPTSENNGENNSGIPSVGQMPILGNTYMNLERKVRLNEALWEALIRQYESAKVQEQRDIPTIRVLDTANVPERKSGPARLHIVMLGSLLSFFIAVIAILLRSLYGELDAQDPRKQLIDAVLAGFGNALRPLERLPGLRWLQDRFARVE